MSVATDIVTVTQPTPSTAQTAAATIPVVTTNLLPSTGSPTTFTSLPTAVSTAATAASAISAAASSDATSATTSADLTTPVIAAIVVGIFFALVIAGFVYFCWTQNKKKGPESKEGEAADKSSAPASNGYSTSGISELPLPIITTRPPSELPDTSPRFPSIHELSADGSHLSAAARAGTGYSWGEASNDSRYSQASRSPVPSSTVPPIRERYAKGSGPEGRYSGGNLNVVGEAGYTGGIGYGNNGGGNGAGQDLP
ncbi:hypothetical protein RUND412_004439 [Rhizina undulata]